ncbi:putative leucine-rich repeat-containing protein DDB_G0290503 isoform X25 [Oncorhynchus masou masou]|uniref:putative leucine-rich repeat-containing protein DDB_G0290503 isoform X25 n=1 Tax=Oncorhynchus masou masou TaxID=90313 RepID=UPI003183A5A3
MTSQDQMRQLYQVLEEAEDSRSVKLDFYRILLDLESNLVRDLDSSELYLYILSQNLEKVIKQRDSNEEERYLYVLSQNLSRQLEKVIKQRVKKLGKDTEEEGAIFVDIHKDQLIQKVTKVMPILHELFYELYCNIRIQQMTSQDQMRQLYQDLEVAEDSRSVKLDFYRILLDLESNLVRDLDSREEVHYLYDLQNLTGQLVPIMQHVFIFCLLSTEKVIKQREKFRKENDSNEEERYLYSNEEERYLYDLQNLSRQLEEVRIENDLQNLTGQLEEVRIENDDLQNLTGQLEKLRTDNDELKEELRKARKTIQSLSTSPGGQQETQTPSQKSKRIQGIKYFPGRKSFPGSGRKSLPGSGGKSAPGSGGKSAPGSGGKSVLEILLAAGPQNDDLDEMERGGRVTIDNNSML